MKDTPMMKRYKALKTEYSDMLLLFRMGDFYELFGEDAEITAKTLGLTITSRDKNTPNPFPMTGFPYHALDAYLRKLIAAGYRVAIAEQVDESTAHYGIPMRIVMEDETGIQHS